MIELRIDAEELRPIIREVVAEMLEASQTAPQDDQLATVAEAAEFLKVARSSVYELINAGKLHRVKIGRSCRLRWTAIHDLARNGANA